MAWTDAQKQAALVARELLASGARHVRTPEGAKHFDQPIGAVIVPDAVPKIHGTLRAKGAPKVKPPIDLSGTYTRVTYRPDTGRAKTIYLRGAAKTRIPGGEAISGTEVDREGSVLDRIHLIDVETVDKAIPVEIDLKYGVLKPASH